MPAARRPASVASPAAVRPAAAARAPNPIARPSPGGRLGALDWLQAGQALLREHGIPAVKLAALTRLLGVSTGSFYHHFIDFDQYLGALAEHYQIDRVMKDLNSAVRGRDRGPVARMRSLSRASVKAGTFELDTAMRAWAAIDPRARAALQRAESLVLDFITQAFCDLGFTRAEASLRARILLSANVSPLIAQGRISRAAFFRGSLRVLTADAPGLRTRR